ncbi:MAG: response regulator transcription factor [Dermatophilaceae bacterium]
MTVRLVVAEDDPLVRSGIVAVLAPEPDLAVVGQAPDGAAAYRLVDTLRPDVVVTDLRMPGVDGVELTQRICRRPAPPPVLVLTTFDGGPDVHAAVRAGARGYLLKLAAPHHLADAVRAVAAGQGWVDPAVAPAVLAAVRRAPQPADGAGRRIERLTAREREVLVLLGQGCSNAEIAATLWLGTGTVKTHVSRILHKTACRDRAQAVALAYASGLAGHRG